MHVFVRKALVASAAILAATLAQAGDSDHHRPHRPGHHHEANHRSIVGCADGEREGFTSVADHPDIAGCSGAWTIPGLHTESPGTAPSCPGMPTVDTTRPACHRRTGDDSSNPLGAGCNAADLCAKGWHVCSGAADVARASPTGCAGATQAEDPPLFFASRQTSTGCGVCATGTGTGPECNSATCAQGCQQRASTSNDIFGCGNFGSEGLVDCGPLDRFSHDLCSGLSGSSWSCHLGGADDVGLCEAYAALKSDSSFGGVLCCRDVDDGDHDDATGCHEPSGEEATCHEPDDDSATECDEE